MAGIEIAHVLRMAKEHASVAPDWMPTDPQGVFLALALAGEAGELANNYKKLWRDGDSPALQAKIDAELSDVGNYALMLAEHRGRSLLVMCGETMAQVETRPEYQALVRKHNEKVLAEGGVR